MLIYCKLTLFLIDMLFFFLKLQNPTQTFSFSVRMRPELDAGALSLE